jgi:hypothetical protein
MSEFFTYRIKWSQLDISYYGVRYSKNSSIATLWTTYFTSSKYVKQFRKKYGEPDIVEVRKKFVTVESALQWEQRVLKKLNVPFNKKYLNANVGAPLTTNASQRGVKKHYKVSNPMDNLESRKNLSETRKQRNRGKQSAKYLKPLCGDDNPMRNPDIVAKYKEKIKGRKRKYLPDGSWTWEYPMAS